MPLLEGVDAANRLWMNRAPHLPKHSSRRLWRLSCVLC